MTDRTRELGTKPIGQLLMQYAVPAIIAMTASSLYNMVDSVFIGRGVGAMAISGLAITFPLMNLSAAFGAMVGVGASTMISVRLGQKDHEAAQHFFGNSVTLNIVMGILFMAVVLLLLDPILLFFGASVQTLPYAREYMQWILYGNVFTHMYFGLNAVLRSAGHPRMAMYATILTVLLNSVLDPLFIYGFGLGIKGAAMATVLAQCVSLVWQLRIFSRRSEVVYFRRDTLRLRAGIVGGILSIGLSPFLMNACSCLVVLLINRGMVEYGGDLAVGAYGIVNRVLFLFAMIVMGFNQGMQPIAGYNYGAQLHHRVREVLYKTIFYATIVMTFGFVLCEIFPDTILSLFTTDSTLTAMAVRGMRIDVALFPIIGFQMVTGNFFQSIGQAGKSIYLSLTRQLIFLVPSLLILPHFFGLDGVWLSLPVSDFLASINAAILLWLQIRHFQATVAPSVIPAATAAAPASVTAAATAAPAASTGAPAFTTAATSPAAATIATPAPVAAAPAASTSPAASTAPAVPAVSAASSSTTPTPSPRHSISHFPFSIFHFPFPFPFPFPFSLLRLPHRIHYFAVNRVAPYIPLFSNFLHDDSDKQ